MPDDTATVKLRRGYTTIPNSTVSDSRISLTAKGLLLYLASHGDSWVFRAETVREACGVGRDKLAALMRELRTHGYLETTPVHGPDGRVTHHKWQVNLGGAS